MRKILALVVALCLAPIGAQAWWQSVVQQSIAASGCSESTTFLARTSGLSGTETSAYTTMICGMVADGVWTKLDALYIFATNTTTTANLNLKSTSFTITETVAGTNSPTFNVDRGYTGVATPKVLDTGLLPSAGGLNYTQNAASIGAYVRNNRTTNANVSVMGISNGNATDIVPLNGGNIQVDINDAAFPTAANTTTQGSWLVTRTAASGAGSIVVYKNGSSFASLASTSGAIPATCSIYILARSLNAGCTINAASTEQLAAAWVGGTFNGTEAANFASRLNAYMTAVGANVY